MSYLNTKPLTYGFEKGMMADEIDLSFAPPASLAEWLQQDKIDIGLIPVAVIPSLSNAQIIGNYCIGAVGPVVSVALFSELPIEELDSILLDTESRTSAALIQILLKNHWKLSPKIMQAYPGYEKDIAGKTGALVIGDRALALLGKTNFHYDLAAAWQELTHLPFVFAAWVSNKVMPADFIQRFDQAVGLGLQHLEEVLSTIDFPFYNLDTYYKKNISYSLDQPKKDGLNLFLLQLKD